MSFTFFSLFFFFNDTATTEIYTLSLHDGSSDLTYYDAIWVYGDPAVYDPVREYAFAPDVAAKVRYTGYLDQRARLEFERRGGKDPVAALGWSGGRLALCLVGGGQDGAELAGAFAEAELPPDTNGLLVTGPCMPAGVRGRLIRSVARNPCRR